MPIAAPAIIGQAREVGQRDPAGRADEHARERRAAAEAAQRQAVGQPLADDEQHERAHRPAGRRPRSAAGQRSWPENSTCDEPSAGALGEQRPRGSPMRDADQRVSAAPCAGRRRAGGPGRDGGSRCRGRRRAIPIAMAHRNSATVGVPNVGMSGTASEKVPKPVRLSRPTKISEPMPAASRPGTSITPSMGPPSPATSISRNAAGQRRPEQRADRGEAAGGADHGDGLSRRVPLQQVDRQHAEPAADRDQRRLGAQHGAQRQRRERGERSMPGSSPGSVAPDALNPSAGSWPPVPGR